MDASDGRIHRSTRPLDAAAGDQVSVHTPKGDVTIESGGTACLRVASTVAFSEAVDVRTRRDGDCVEVAVERTEGVDAPVDVRLELPRGVRVGSASTGRGDVTVRDVDGTPAVEAGEGDVTVAGTDDLASVWTGDGDADVEVASLTEDSIVEAVTGDVSVGLPEDVDATFEMMVNEGDVTAPDDVFDEVAVRKPNYVRAVRGTGDAVLTAKTSEGDVTIQQA